MGRKIGYYQLFDWEDQQQEMESTLDNQGCVLVFRDVIGKSREPRPGMLDSMEAIRPQDTILIPNIHMLGADIESWIRRISEMLERGAEVTLMDSGLTFNSGDKMSLFFSSALEAKDKLFRLGKSAGGAAAKGGSGRKRSMNQDDERRLFLDFETGQFDTKQLADKYSISTSTVNRILRRKREEEESE